MRPSSPDSQLVTVFAPVHKDSNLDLFSMGQLPIHNFFIFAAADQFLPKWMADKMNQDISMIVVGRGSDLPIQEVLQKLKQNYAKNLFIYPQGTVTMVNETGPARKKFAEGLLTSLVREGYQVQIIPITYDTPARFVARRGKNEAKNIVVKAHPPVTPEFYQAMSRRSPLTINLFLRATWIENQSTTPQLLHGQLKMGALEQKKADLLPLQPLTEEKLRFIKTQWEKNQEWGPGTCLKVAAPTALAIYPLYRYMRANSQQTTARTQWMKSLSKFLRFMK